MDLGGEEIRSSQRGNHLFSVQHRHPSVDVPRRKREKAMMPHSKDVLARCQRLTPDEQDKLVERWNQTSEPWADDPCLHELFVRQAEKTPDAPAVIFDDKSLSYGELHTQSTRVAERLIESGVAPEEVVGVVLDGTPNAYIGILGILKAGAAYLPINPDFPRDRILFFLRQAEARFLVGELDAAIIEEIPRLCTIAIDGESSATGTVKLPNVAAESLAYVLFTSGSTGKPKGVMLNHRGPVNTVRDINVRLQVGQSDRALALSSLGFDLSVFDLFGMWGAGGAIVLPTPSESRDPAKWANLIDRHDITIWNSVPALMEMLVTFFEGNRVLSSLRLVMLSGDWIPVTLPDRIRLVAPQAELVSLGGSTEVSIWSVIFPIDGVDPKWTSIPYGKPLRNQQCYVVDEQSNLCKIGETGELCLGGVGVALGYLNRPDLTEQQFVSDPFGKGTTLYRTGDLCRYGEDGNIEFLGRADQQVKIHGYRIGLGEIESEITKLTGVREAAVIANEGNTGARLIAYAVFEDGHEICLAELNQRLAESLPHYMLPSALVAIERLPLTANGKVDRKSLPIPQVNCDAGADLSEVNETGAFLVATLRDLLHLPNVDPKVGFMELGGNSLAAVALAARVKAKYGVRLEFWGILAQSPSTIELSQQIDDLVQNKTAESYTVSAIGHESLSVAPVSSHQQQMWIEHFLVANRGRYNIPLVYDVKGEFNLDAFEHAYQQVVDRHHVLRTVYEATAEGLVQRVLSSSSFSIDRIDLRDRQCDERAQLFETQAREYVTKPFDLSMESPIRLRLYHIGEEQYRIVLAVHHIAFDGHSIGVLQRDLAECYNAARDNRAPQLPKLSHQYANYSVWQRQRLEDGSLEQDRDYWREKLGGELPVLDLPRDRSNVDDTASDTCSLTVDGDLLESVRTFSAERQSTLFVTLLSAIKAVFHRYTQQEDIVIGSAVTSRDDLAMEDLVGYFINVLPLRTRFDGSDSFECLQAKVRDTAFDAFAHQRYPLDLLKKEIFSEGEMGDAPFRVLFILENQPDALSLDGASTTTIPFDTRLAKFDLLIAVNESPDRLRIELQYRCKQFHRRRVERFGEHLRGLLASAVVEPSCPVDQLKILSSNELATVLPSSSILDLADDVAIETSVANQAFISVLSLFDDQVRRTPDSPALSFEGEYLTYAHLDRRASELAERLSRLGVQQNVPVAIMLERSFDMIVGVLAVMKAGGCYVPVDPSLPMQRRRRILENCHAGVLISETTLVDRMSADEAGTVLHDLHVVSIDRNNEPEDESYATAEKTPGVQLDDLAYILYTSGSTGEPKGVAMRHGAVANLIDWQLRNSEASVGTKTLQFASLGFDVSFQEIFATLCGGGELQLVSSRLQQDLLQLWRFIVDAGTERVFVPFVVLRTLAEVANDRSQQSSLREVMTAGERLEITPVVRNFFAKRPECRLWNHYGPTETHVATAHPLDRDALKWDTVPPIGTPINKCVAVVLDENLQPVPQGVDGELYLGGECLAQGYFGNETLTSERFIENPHPNLPTERLYRTGDIARLNWDHQLEFIRRNDLQVKVRGHRVELSEIESVLAQCPGVRQAVVTFQRSGLGGQLNAHVIRDNESLSPRVLEDFLRTHVPAYMMVSHFDLVDEFPMTPSGKVDRKRLASIKTTTIARQASEQVMPTTGDPLIDRITEIWQSVLGVDGLDSESHFFDCGGDSLSAAILFTRLEKEFGKAVSMTKLVSSPTIGELAEVYRQNESHVEEYWNDLVRLDPRGKIDRDQRRDTQRLQAPLFCFPGIDGHLLNFREIAAMLGEDRDVYGVQPIGLDGERSQPEAIEDLARQHVEMIRRVTPHGPYHLAGFSFGGVVAYEVAQQLRRCGETVTLAIIDAFTGLPIPAPLHQNLLFHLRYAKECQGRQRWTYLYERLVGMVLAIRYRFGWITMEQRLERIIGTKGIYAKVAAKNMDVITRYRPGAAEGPATLYKAKLRANWPGRDRTDPQLGWGAVFQEQTLEVVEVDGAHANMLSKARVRGLVEHMRQRIQNG
ncbi:pyoverdine synthetase D [Rhodopirellula sallentina SM41]|uniref:Pyoverdine synthetase D n=2 Tax=Rhodopirellula TaxID=265488 RepID=M5UHF4_9BACT|nr:pyoverdine synthetase D [Rhodopirellula sallentina SM41]